MAFPNDFVFSGLHKLTRAPGKSVAEVHSGKNEVVLGSEDGSDCLAFNKEAPNTGSSTDNCESSIIRNTTMFSRRDMLAASAMGAAMTVSAANAGSFGNPDEPPQGSINAKNPGSVTDPGPQNPAIRDQFPSAFSPPATDVGSMPLTWASFNNVPRRIQDGGWAREVTQADFAISKEISGVNMRLTAGGIRELHWHQAAEGAYMTYVQCRITVIDPTGRPYVADVKEGDIWYFPAGYPHSLQGLAPDGCEFVICFDNGAQSEFNTLLVNRLARPHASFCSCRKLWRFGRDVRKHSPAQSLDLSRQSAGRPVLCSDSDDWNPGRSARAVHVLSRVGAVQDRDEGRHLATRR